MPAVCGSVWALHALTSISRGPAVRGQCFGLTYQTHFLGQLLTLVCASFKIRHQVGRQQLVARTQPQTLLLCVLTQRNSRTIAGGRWLNRTKNTCTWSPALGEPTLITSCYHVSGRERLRGLICWGHKSHLSIVISNIWTVSRAVLSPVEGLSHSMPHLPLMDSRCPTGLWTLSAWDVPNVHQLPGSQFRARHQPQAQTHKKNH